MAQTTGTELVNAYEGWSTPHIADACLRLGVEARFASAGVAPVSPGMSVQGPVAPVRHYGSVDVFLMAFDAAAPGSVIVIDNQARVDEACIGDLTVLEARAAGMAGMVVWGLWRDTPELRRIGFPVFGRGALPMGPRSLRPVGSDALVSARIDDFVVTADDHVFADDDGVVFVPRERLADVLEAAHAIMTTERAQAEKVVAGETLRDQLRFAEYMAKRADDPTYSFRDHLREIGGAIEE